MQPKQSGLTNPKPAPYHAAISETAGISKYTQRPLHHRYAMAPLGHWGHLCHHSLGLTT